MEDASEISLRQAAAAFGPCAGGTDNALRKIIDKLEGHEFFWRKFVGDRSRLRGADIDMNTSDWFRIYSSLSSQNPAGDDPEFDDFRDEVERILYRSDDLVLDYDQVRSIWFPQDFANFIPTAKLDSAWSWTQALAWVASKDLGIVGAIDDLGGIERTGWLAVLLSERCDKCEKLATTPRWQQCHCLTDACSSLHSNLAHRFSQDLGPPKLDFSVENGSINSDPSSVDVRFDPSDIRSIFPAEISAIVTPSKKKGAKVITDEARDLWQQRRENGQKASNSSAEASQIHKWLTDRHKASNVRVPKAGTIRKRMKDWLEELGEAE